MGKKKFSQRKGGGCGQEGPYRTPTAGYKDQFFTCGPIKLPTDFIDMQKQLTRYSTGQTHPGASDANVAYETMISPNLDPLVKPTRITEVKKEDGATEKRTLNGLDYRILQVECITYYRE